MNPTLLERFFQNAANAHERKEVIDWLLDPQNDPEIRFWLQNNWERIENFSAKGEGMDPDMERIWNKIQDSIFLHTHVSSSVESFTDSPAPSSIPAQVTPLSEPEIQTAPSRLHHLARYAAAAALITLIAALSYFIVQRDALLLPQQPVAIVQPDIHPPVDSRAVLTLADGSKVYLDSSANGTLARQGDVAVQRNENGEIVYTGDATIESFNTLSIPRGSKPIRLVLADGSLVWLNAASSITYPTAFTAKERRVRMTGEAYFEVARQENRPFFVDQGGLNIQVLGTHFNVNGNEDEKTSMVTLLEGSVSVSSATRSVTLVPGQQASFALERLKVLNGVDTEEVMAWKNGLFFFTGTGVREMMKQIEKYYDVEVEFRDEIPYQFVAKISRDVPVSAFLEKLELTNLIHFKIEGRKIVVMK
jgi:transmembrane sensor